MRLIDADALRKQLRQNLCPINGADVYFVRQLIDNAPTIDKGYNEGHIDGMLKAEKLYARPIGRWLDEKFVAFHLTCDQCGCNIRRQREEVFEGNYKYNFCPNCGAKMEES